MTNKQLIEKLKEDMEMRGFSHHTKDSYLRKAKEVVEYFEKPMKQVTTKELREFLIKHLREEKKVSERTSNYYNSVIRFDHIFRREGKEKILWNIATDAVINALLKQDGLEMIEGGINIPEAENFNAEDMYEKLLEERRKQQKSFKDNNEKQNVGHDSHDLWDKAIEERKQEEVIGEINKSEKVDEKKEIEENRDERKRRLRDFSRELVNRSKWKTKF